MPRDFTHGLSDDDLQAAKEMRDSRIHAPTFDPGMDIDDEDSDLNKFGMPSQSSSSSDWDTDDWGDNNFSSNNQFGQSNSFPGMQSSFSNGFNMQSQAPSSGFSLNYGMQGNNMYQQQQQQVMSDEDKFWKTAGDAAKKGVNFISDFVGSFSTFNVRHCSNYGKLLCIFSGITILISFLLWTVFPFKVIVNGIIGGLLGVGTGVIMFMFAFSAAKNMSNETQQQEQMKYDRDVQGYGYEDEPIEEPEHIEEPEPEPSGNEGFNWNEIVNEPEPKFVSKNFSNSTQDEEDEPIVSSDKVVENFSKVDGNMMTRQFLYENLLQAMETKNSSFDKTIELPEDSREFLSFVKFVNFASNQIKGKQKGDDIDVLEVQDKLFYTLLKLSRPSWFPTSKLNNFIEEVVNQYAYDETTSKVNSNIVGSGQVVGDKIILKIMKGETAVVTVKDVLKIKKNEVLDTKNKMPVVIGIDAEGNPMLVDFAQFHSLMISGAPRSGKSWAVKAILGQVMMFSSPEDVEFYYADPKNTISDFYTIDTPHVRKFVSTNKELIQLTDYFVHTVAPERSRMLNNYGGYKDIKDLKHDHPEIKMPYLYLVIDEIVTFTQSMTNEENDVFKGLLREFVTRLPSLGIRLMVVPHLIKNQVIDKTVTSMIKNRFSVRGTPDEIEDTLDVSKKDFPYKLNYPGDMAVHLDGITLNGPIFLHSAVISNSNQGYDEFFKMLTNSWLKMRPETFKGSKLEYNVKNYITSPREYPILKDILGEDEFERLAENYDEYKKREMSGETVFAGSMSTANADSKPARPSRPKTSSSANNVQPSRPARPNRPSRPTQSSNDIEIEDSMEQVMLSDDEQKDFLMRANPPKKSKSKVSIDDDYI